MLGIHGNFTATPQTHSRYCASSRNLQRSIFDIILNCHKMTLGAPPSPTASLSGFERAKDWEDYPLTDVLDHAQSEEHPNYDDVILDRNISAEQVASLNNCSMQLEDKICLEHRIQVLALELPDVSGKLLLEMVTKQMRAEHVEETRKAMSIAKACTGHYEWPGSFKYEIASIERAPSSLALIRFFNTLFECMDLSVKPEFVQKRPDWFYERPTKPPLNPFWFMAKRPSAEGALGKTPSENANPAKTPRQRPSEGLRAKFARNIRRKAFSKALGTTKGNHDRIEKKMTTSRQHVRSTNKRKISSSRNQQ